MSETNQNSGAFGMAPAAPVDLVNHPPHYKQGGIETIDFIEAKGLNYHLGNAVKYITRADHKGTALQDLRKARWYLDREVQRREADLRRSQAQVLTGIALYGGTSTEAVRQ